MRRIRSLMFGPIAAGALAALSAAPAVAHEADAVRVPGASGHDHDQRRRRGRHRRLPQGPPQRRVPGAAAHVRVNGRCKLISVSGAGADIRANVVDRIRVSGAYARVSYRASASGGAASVRVTGVGAKVTRRG